MKQLILVNIYNALANFSPLNDPKPVHGFHPLLAI